jgi:hypothetical protein
VSDNPELKRISKMSLEELLIYILCSPENLTDPYYREFGTAIRARAAQLIGPDV